ncbi:hypothetical protein [Acidisoma sp. 7E03]
MADTPLPSPSERSLTESEACSNAAAFALWAAARGETIATCDGAGRESMRHLLSTCLEGQPDWLWAALLLDADLRPDDRLWVEGPPPAWLQLACSLTAGLASCAEAATVWIGPHLPAVRPPGLSRVIILDGDVPVVSGLHLVSVRDWDQARESSAD